MGAAVGLVFVVLTMWRVWLAARYEARKGMGLREDVTVTVVQPVLGGDPRLAECLRRNAEASPWARFVWMVDEDDEAGLEAAQASARENVLVVLGPGPRDGENPKLVKLERALEHVRGEVVVVLDDDSVIEAAGLLRIASEAMEGDLVTGLPEFVAGEDWWEKLVGGFVNGNAWATYFAVAEVGDGHTINGMIYAARLDVLRELGGFAAAGMALTDDYAVARMFERAGRRIVQSRVRVEVRLTMEGVRHYVSVMRRWMIFARMYFGEQRGVMGMLLAGLPAVMPLTVTVAWGWWGLGLVVLKALVVRGMARVNDGVVALVVADLLTPVFFVLALVMGNRMRWRKRKIVLEGGGIRYRA